MRAIPPARSASPDPAVARTLFGMASRRDEWRVTFREIERALGLKSPQTERLALRWEIAAYRFKAALLRYAGLHCKAGFDPNQPRDERGRWTDSGAGENRPQVPNERPPTAKLRNRVIKEVAKWLAKVALKEVIGGPIIGTLLNVLDTASWLYEAYPHIAAYCDPPKTMDELQKAVSTPMRGYDVHHIVEQTPAEQDGYPRLLVDSPANLVRIPTLKHWEITGWYMRKNRDYGDVSPRTYLREKDWSERVTVGERALIEYGILKP